MGMGNCPTRRAVGVVVRAVGLATVLAPAISVDNGLGIRSPRGWRTWDAFLSDVNQAKMKSAVDAMVDKSRLVDGVPTSLLQLGYDHIGLDDGWQACGHGINGSFHSASGIPLYNNKTFPSPKAMTAYARAHGVASGFYLNTCDCCERGHLAPNWGPQMEGDTSTVVDWGFTSLKLDSCGPSQDLIEWSRLLNKTGTAVLLENCFDNASFPFTASGVDDGEGDVVTDAACPMNFFRAGGDMRADWPLMLRWLQTVVPWLGLSRPGCWAYLDMLEVANPPGGTGESPAFENKHSWRAHFGAWAITSSPLVLSFDLTNASKLDAVWDIITNRGVLAVNWAWAGQAGRLVSSTYDQGGPTPVFARPCSSSVDTQKFVLGRDGMLRSAAGGDRRCISTPGCAQPSAMPRLRSDVGRPSTGGLRVAECDGSASQRWNLTGDPAIVTNVKSVADGGCWEINGCGGSTVDTDYGCKALPKDPLPCSGCCNMAWTFTPEGTIVSGLADRGCLQVSPADESTVVVGRCVHPPSKRQLWRRGHGETIVSADGGCVDNHAHRPLNPQYGPIVLAACDASDCGGLDHRWTHDRATGQLVSSVPGVGSARLCAEVQGYFNHYSPLNVVGCADPSTGPVPRTQRFTVDQELSRVSVDVRFNSSNQRSPGQVLCADIDFSALPSGEVRNGSRLLDQVWAKRVDRNGTTAVLFLNADTEVPRDVQVDLTAIVPSAATLEVRDLWQKVNLGTVKGRSMYIAHKVPPQDSIMLLFVPLSLSVEAPP